MGARTVVLVEGASDRLALEALAERLALNLDRVQIQDVGGVTNFRSFLLRYGPLGEGRRVAGLCDFPEWPIVLNALAASGVGSPLSFATLRDCGFFVCRADLEDELLAAVGAPTVLRIIEQHGDRPRFRSMQRQLPYRSLSLETQVRHLMTQKKIAYAPALIAALSLSRVPPPLADVLRYATAATRP